MYVYRTSKKKQIGVQNESRYFATLAAAEALGPKAALRIVSPPISAVLVMLLWRVAFGAVRWALSIVSEETILGVYAAERLFGSVSGH